jgi:hypothetical protein
MQPFFPQKGYKTTPEHKSLYISREIKSVALLPFVADEKI